MRVKRLLAVTFLLSTTLLCVNCGHGKNQAMEEIDLQEEVAKATPAAAPVEAGRPTGDPVCLDTNIPAEKWAVQAEQLLEEGWAPGLEGAEGNRFLWAVSEKASFHFWIDAPEKGGVLTLIGWTPQGGSKPPQKVGVEVNGKKAGEVTLAEASNTYRVDIPAAILQKGKNRFQLNFAKTMVPKELGMGNDERRLAAGFRLIVFQANQEAAAPAPPPAK